MLFQLFSWIWLLVLHTKARWHGIFSWVFIRHGLEGKFMKILPQNLHVFRAKILVNSALNRVPLILIAIHELRNRFFSRGNCIRKPKYWLAPLNMCPKSASCKVNIQGYQLRFLLQMHNGYFRWKNLLCAWSLTKYLFSANIIGVFLRSSEWLHH